MGDQSSNGFPLSSSGQPPKLRNTKSVPDNSRLDRVIVRRLQSPQLLFVSHCGCGLMWPSKEPTVVLRGDAPLFPCFYETEVSVQRPQMENTIVAF